MTRLKAHSHWSQTGHILASLFAIALPLVLSGCDTLCGVRRTVYVDRLPSDENISAALAAVPNIQSVRREYNQFSYRVGISPISFGRAKIDNVGGVLDAGEDHRGRKYIEIYELWMNEVPPWQLVEHTRYEMDVVYGELRKRAPYLPKPQEVREKLEGMLKKQ